MQNGMTTPILKVAAGIAAFGFISLVASFGLTTCALNNAGKPPLSGISAGTLLEVHATGAEVIVYADERAYRRHLSLTSEGDLRTLALEQTSLTACAIMGRARIRLLTLRDDIARIEVISGDQWGCRGYVTRADLASYTTPIDPAGNELQK